ncbi:MAG: hypothetical protein IJJ71_07580 [Treponema sp.]|uniref:hypothetical protein n=1 Tax=Treponema sp. TaxID=166 RepID=UPI0025F78941|nr:hypothetical protein [Treponema sp.]MBR0496017.1 hypothetical protein [Treponema sp.]
MEKVATGKRTAATCLAAGRVFRTSLTLIPTLCFGTPTAVLHTLADYDIAMLVIAILNLIVNALALYNLVKKS